MAQDRVCDFADDCGDNSDEQNCGKDVHSYLLTRTGWVHIHIFQAPNHNIGKDKNTKKLLFYLSLFKF